MSCPYCAGGPTEDKIVIGDSGSRKKDHKHKKDKKDHKHKKDHKKREHKHKHKHDKKKSKKHH